MADFDLVLKGTVVLADRIVEGGHVAVRDGKPIFMGDVARIEDGPDQPRRYVVHATRDKGKPLEFEPFNDLVNGRRSVQYVMDYLDARLES